MPERLGMRGVLEDQACCKQATWVQQSTAGLSLRTSSDITMSLSGLSGRQERFHSKKLSLCCFNIEGEPHCKGRRLPCRKVQELSGEIVGLQDVLSEAGAEEVTKAMRMKELDTQVGQQRRQLSLV